MKFPIPEVDWNVLKETAKKTKVYFKNEPFVVSRKLFEEMINELQEAQMERYVEDTEDIIQDAIATIDRFDALRGGRKIKKIIGIFQDE